MLTKVSVDERGQQGLVTWPESDIVHRREALWQLRAVLTEPAVLSTALYPIHVY